MEYQFSIEKIQKQRQQDREYLYSIKLNAEEKMTNSLKWERKFNFKYWRESEENQGHEKGNIEGQADFSEEFDMECSQIALWLRNIRPAYIAPVYSYNNYIDALIRDIYWDDIKYEIDESMWISSSLRETQIIIELQNCLLSIKMGLDRIVKLISMFYKGISWKSTFGHIKIKEDGTEKGTNFMAYVLANKDKDDLFAFIYEEYKEWIKECVQPRNAITHYSDFSENYVFDGKSHSIYPIHFNFDEGGQIVTSSVEVTEYVNRYYGFYEEILKHFYSQEKIL